MNSENPPKTHENKPLLTINEAARYLRVGRTTLYQLIKEGELQIVKLVQGRTLFLQRDLDSFIESKKSKLIR
jgi:excisionase family DNA binding protein